MEHWKGALEYSQAFCVNKAEPSWCPKPLQQQGCSSGAPGGFPSSADVAADKCLPLRDKAPGCMAELPESRNASKRLFLWLPVSKSSLLKASNGYVAPGHYCSYLPGFLPGTKNRFGHYLPNPPQVTACPTLHGCKQRSVDPATTNKAPTYISGDTHLTVK